MGSKIFKRDYKEDRPVLAVCYDFDKTLSPDDMQAQGYIQSVGEDVSEFWKESNGLAESNDMDQNLAYMYMMKEKAKGRLLFTRKTLEEYGSEVHLFPGVREWFKRMNAYGEEKGVVIEHYVISSGLKEMIEGTPIAGEFRKIYASSFYCNHRGEIEWPAQVVNYTNKTQFLFRIEKGVLDVNDPGVNDSFAPEEIRVPFRNMVYIGDSDTDIPCMKLVNTYGGHSIGVFNVATKDKAKVYKMMRDGRIRYYVPADYTEGAALDDLIKSIIDRTATNEALESIHYECRKEYVKADKQSSEEDQKKSDLMIALENSDSFARTHSIISDLRQYNEWTREDKDELFEIALHNSQILYILNDLDVKGFYKKLLGNMNSLKGSARKVKEIIEENE